MSRFGLRGDHVEVVGTIQAGMPSPSLPKVGENDLRDAFMRAIGMVLVLMAEALAAARTFATKHNYDIDSNQELRTMDAANIASGLFGGMIVGGGMSGSAAKDTNGGRSQLSTITASLAVALTLAFFLPLICNLREAVLGAIVVHAVAHLADGHTLKYYARPDTGSICGTLIAMLGVVQMGILKRLIFAVGLTFMALMYKLSTNKDSVLGRLPGTENFVNVERYNEAEQIPGLIIFQPSGILFCKTNRIHNRLRLLVKQAPQPLQAVLINLKSRPEMDVTSLEMFRQIRSELVQLRIELTSPCGRPSSRSLSPQWVPC